MRIESSSPNKTKLIGRLFGEELRRSTLHPKRATVIALIGTLGSGKTTFTQGFAKGLGARGRIASPTFILARIHRISESRFTRLVHMDAYRLTSARDLPPLGFRELLADPKTVLLIEWADRILPALPKGTVVIRSSHLRSEKLRSFSFSLR